MNMNLFNFFGTKRKNDTQSPQKVIHNMRSTLDTLEKREQFLEKRINVFKTNAKEVVKTNKQKALMLLKKAKMNEKQLLSIYGQKENIEIQICTLEQGISNQNIISSMKQGKNAIENIGIKLNPDDIGELMEEINEGINNADEIANVMSTPIGQQYDDDDLLAELEEQSENIEKLINSLSVDGKTLVTTEPVNRKSLTVEEKELAELEQLMTM
jgi:hypothetical protein